MVGGAVQLLMQSSLVAGVSLHQECVCACVCVGACALARH